MPQCRAFQILGVLAFLTTLGSLSASPQEIKSVFVIAMENHNWTQPANQFAGKAQQILQNPNAPFINSLVNGTAVATVNGSVIHISKQVAYATAYHNVLVSGSRNDQHIHPSEPNYIWSEAGNNFGVASDNDPYSSEEPTHQTTPLHLSNLLTKAGKTWKSYQEDIDLTLSGGKVTNVPLRRNKWTVPLASFSGFSSSYFNAYNDSSQFNYAAKHNPMVLFDDTDGGGDSTPANPLSAHYAPLQQLPIDLADGATADYNWITPDEYNDMHSAIGRGYKGLSGDAARIRQGDDFLSEIVPIIMASNAYKNRGAIVIWWDESEADAWEDDPDDLRHTIGEIVISPLAHANVNGLPYASSVAYTHSSDLRTMQEIFHVAPFLGDAANANDLSDLFDPGAIPQKR